MRKINRSLYVSSTVFVIYMIQKSFKSYEISQKSSNLRQNCSFNFLWKSRYNVLHVLQKSPELGSAEIFGPKIFYLVTIFADSYIETYHYSHNFEYYVEEPLIFVHTRVCETPIDGNLITCAKFGHQKKGDLLKPFAESLTLNFGRFDTMCRIQYFIFPDN